MNKKLDIILVEDDVLDCEKMASAIDAAYEDFNLVAITNSANTAIKNIRELQPDIIILDLELTFGQGNGFEVLESIKNDPLPFNPYIVITTNNISNITHSIVRDNGGDFIFTKVQKGYSASQVIDFLKSAKQSIINRRQYDNASITSIPTQTKKQHLFRVINNYLLDIGISPKHIGFEYLKEAIYYTAIEPSKPFIPIIASEHKKSQPSVERSMQNAINKTWSTENIEDLLNKYKAKISSSRGTPTINEFVYYYSNLLRTESRL